MAAVVVGVLGAAVPGVATWSTTSAAGEQLQIGFTNPEIATLLEAGQASLQTELADAGCRHGWRKRLARLAGG